MLDVWTTLSPKDSLSQQVGRTKPRFIWQMADKVCTVFGVLQYQVFMCAQAYNESLKIAHNNKLTMITINKLDDK